MKISLAFDVTEDRDSNGTFYSIKGIDGVGGYYSTETKAKRILKTKVASKVFAGFSAIKHTQSLYIFCGDGTVLRVGFYCGAWGYEIIRPGQRQPGSSVVADTFEGTVEKAKEHAIQCWGGVKVD